jgi:SAM-dependent methyltransferase
MFKTTAKKCLAFLPYAGPPVAHRAADLEVLERFIFPYLLSRNDLNRILFVGADWYTVRYNRVFRDRDYCTLEINPTRRVYGVREHIVDDMQNLTRHFAMSHLDVVIFNGIFGGGLGELDTWKRTVKACEQVLRPGGLLIHGWDNVPARRSFSPDEAIESHSFERFEIPELGVSSYAVGDRNPQVYDFYLKRFVPEFRSDVAQNRLAPLSYELALAE